MGQFLQTYGSWIIFGVLMVLMFRMHSGHGDHSMMGHGDSMSHEQHDDETASPTQDVPLHGAYMAQTPASIAPSASDTVPPTIAVHPAAKLVHAQTAHGGGCH